MVCTDVQHCVQCVQCSVQQGGRDNAECAVSHSWEAAERGAESDMRVTRGDNSDTEPGETKEHCAEPPSEYKLMLTTIHKLVITTFYDWDLGLTMVLERVGRGVFSAESSCCSVATTAVCCARPAGRYQDIMSVEV